MKTKLVDTRIGIADGGCCQRWWGGKSVDSKHSSEARKGDNPDLPAMLTEYSLKGFEFGNWLSQNERYDHVLACDDSLKDLCKIMHTKNLGFDCSIGVAFGARGRAGALAHYEPKANMINLTKENGAGSLAHEYGHALDYNIGRMIDQHRIYDALTGGRVPADEKAYARVLNMGCQFRSIVNGIIDYLFVENNERLMKACVRIDLGKLVFEEYWIRRTEIWARAFEQYVCYKLKQQGQYNKYLTFKWESYINDPVYFPEESMKKVAPLFDKFCEMYGDYTHEKYKLRTALPLNNSTKYLKMLKEGLLIDRKSLLRDLAIKHNAAVKKKMEEKGKAAAAKTAAKKTVVAKKVTKKATPKKATAKKSVAKKTTVKNKQIPKEWEVRINCTEERLKQDRKAAKYLKMIAESEGKSIEIYESQFEKWLDTLSTQDH